MMKRILLALAILLGYHSGAFAQKTKAALTTEINTNLAGGATPITAGILRTTILDIINSYYDLNGLSTVSCGSNTFVTSFPTLSSVTCTQPSVANISGFGTGVATALGVNVGTAGAPVINGGVLGTPSSATLTSATGLPLTTGVTGTLPVANGGTNDTGTAWTTFTPTFTCGTATFTTTSAKSKTLGKTTWLEFDVTITAVGTCANTTSFTLPNTANSGGAIGGREIAVNGKGIFCSIASASSTASCAKTDASTFVVNEHYLASGVYENQ